MRGCPERAASLSGSKNANHPLSPIIRSPCSRFRSGAGASDRSRSTVSTIIIHRFDLPERNPVMRRRFLLIAAALTACATLGADWSQFRGPGGSGTSDETGLPVVWSDKENLVWRAKL